MTESPFRLADQEYDPATPIAKLKEHPLNPNQGDVGAISESLDEHGFYGAVIAQKSTGYILAGNHRFRTANAKNAKTLPTFWVKCDDDEAKRILAVDNRTTHLASFDEAKLVELLASAAEHPRGLSGTGYDGDDLDSLVHAVGKPLVIPDAPTGAGYAETDEEEETRKELNANYQDRKQAGALVEMILVFTRDQRTVVGTLIDNIRAAINEPEARAAEVVLRSLRIFDLALQNKDKGVVAELVADSEGDGDEGPA